MIRLVKDTYELGSHFRQSQERWILFEKGIENRKHVDQYFGSGSMVVVSLEVSWPSTIFTSETVNVGLITDGK